MYFLGLGSTTIIFKLLQSPWPVFEAIHLLQLKAHKQHYEKAGLLKFAAIRKKNEIGVGELQPFHGFFFENLQNQPWEKHFSFIKTALLTFVAANQKIQKGRKNVASWYEELMQKAFDLFAFSLSRVKRPRLIYATQIWEESKHSDFFFLRNLVARFNALQLPLIIIVYNNQEQNYPSKKDCAGPFAICVFVENGSPQIGNKYAIMLAILHLGLDVIFFDADLVFFRDPTRQILYEASGRDFMFSTEHTTQSLSPSLIYAKSASILAVKTLIYYAVWLFSNPWASDFHGWDVMLANEEGDLSGDCNFMGWRYKKYRDPAALSFLHPDAPIGKASFGRLSSKFASGDGNVFIFLLFWGNFN